jgi:EmrB/QacA subfamily drug resistance transporter
MHGRPITQPVGDTHASHPNRWRILGVLVLALLVTSIDHTIINVAMPRLVGDLGASSAQLQWIVASYTIVFAGLLLTAGSIGDRFGRRHALLAGFVTFLAGSVVAATAASTTALIAGRCVMGVGGALIMPTTLSILVNVFGDPRERAKAIAGWTAASGAGIALGPIVGGALMRSFSWSSVFWINVPLLVAAIVAALHLVPDSRDPHATRIDPVGAGLSIAAISTLVYSIIQAPDRGWTSTASIVNFAVGAVIACVFVGWEMRRDEPMLDMSLFRNRSFSAGSIALALLFFAMAGTVFLQAQYLQFVLDFTPLAAGLALVPAAIGMLVGSGGGAHLTEMHGGRIAVTAGTLLAGAGVVVQATFADGGSYVPTGVGLLLFGLGAGVAMPPATEMIMATLPPARAGVGSAVNDTVREFGGALGVAVIGSVAATGYATAMRGELDRFPTLTNVDRHMLLDNVGAAIHTSQHLGDQADQVAAAARTAFVDSMHGSLWIAVGLACCAALVTLTQLPRQASQRASAGHGHHAGLGHHAGHHAGLGQHAGHHGGHRPQVAMAEAATSAEVSAS